MDKDRDLLPWIFGGLSMATVAMAITLGSTYGTAPRNLQSSSPIATHALPDAEAPIARTPAPAQQPAPAQTLAAAQTQTAAPPAEPSGQVWECTINGQKTCSDNPCGDRSSLREIGPINRMDPTPVPPHARSFAPGSSYQPEYSYPGEQVDSYAGDRQFASNVYPVFIPFYDHRRPVHGHRPRGHDRGSPSRRN
jgi:hypothetical protein